MCIVAFYHITGILSSNETWNRRLIDKPITPKHSLIIGAITMEICTHNSLSHKHILMYAACGLFDYEPVSLNSYTGAGTIR